MEYDFLIIGAGPSGLACAIHLKNLAKLENRDISVCVLEKASQIGAHALSGAVLEPRSLQELLPNSWQQAPIFSEVKEDYFYYLSKNKAYKLPTPKPMQNEGNYIVSLGNICKFIGEKAQELGVEIYPGFAATKIIYAQDHTVQGVITGEMGIDKNNNKTPNYQPGIHIYAKQTIFAEGCRGQLSEQIIKKFDLRLHKSPQTYAIGIKEVWEIPAKQHYLGRVVHTVGWPINMQTYGGSFIYHITENRVALGFVIGLDYSNPWLNTFQETQKFKTHPFIKNILEGGTRISYGAKALIEGGWQSLPKLSFPGGILIGDAAGFLNMPKIKGIHTAIKSGMLAAATSLETLNSGLSENNSYSTAIHKSWLGKELYKVRNIRPGFKYGLIPGLINAAFETYITMGRSPWTLKNHADYTQLKNADKSIKITYPKPDGKITFDISSSVFLSNIYHTENQPCHLHLREKNKVIAVNYTKYAAPETRYCPAGVYEIVQENNKPKLQINSQNCIHCKTCDIKDPTQNIVWTAPEGGSGPNYIEM